MRMRGALVGGALAVALLACTGGSATAASDPGWFDGHSREERQAIVDYVYERTGHEPPYEGSPETMSGQITDSVLDAGEDGAPFAGDIGALELVTATRVGLLARVGAMNPTLWAVGGTFVAGFAIGTGARKLFATLIGPDDAGADGDPEWAWESVSWHDEGDTIFFGARVQQSPGTYLYDSYDSAGVIRWWQPPCDFNGFTPAAGARMQTGVEGVRRSV